MEEGYRALAKEHDDFVRMSAGIAHEVLPKGDWLLCPTVTGK
jgi:hypothetical protein